MAPRNWSIGKTYFDEKTMLRIKYGAFPGGLPCAPSDIPHSDNGGKEDSEC